MPNDDYDFDDLDLDHIDEPEPELFPLAEFDDFDDDYRWDRQARIAERGERD